MPTIHVKNFQSIKDARIEVKGFTALTGPNNSGKTALMRAIRGAFQNTSGSALVRNGESELEVSVEFEDALITWKKGLKSKPTYVLNGGDPVHPGREVPEAVKALGVVPIEAGGREIWPTLAPQFTGQVFLLDRPGSHLAEAVADIERVSQLNTALKTSERDRRAVSSELKVRRKDLEAAKENLARYGGLDEVLSQVHALAELRAKAEKMAKVAQKLMGLKGRLQAPSEVVQSLAPLEQLKVPASEAAMKALRDLEEAQALASRLQAAKDDVAALAEFSEVETPDPTEALSLASEGRRAEALRERLVSSRKAVSTLSGVEVSVPDIVSSHEKMGKLAKALAKLQGYQVRVSEAASEVDRLAGLLRRQVETQAQVCGEVDALIQDLGVCPTCGKDHS